MTSKAIDVVLEQHNANTNLNATAPPLTAENSKDLRADEWPAQLDEQIIAATMEALEGGQTHYVSVPGIDPLREAFATNLGIEGVGASNVVVTAGVQESRFLTVQMIGESYERIAIPAVVHPGVRKALGVRPMAVHSLDVSQETQLATLESIEAALADGVRLLFLESPSRLTGAFYTPQQLESIARMVTDSDAAVIWDQGLGPWSDAESLAEVDGMAARTALIGEGFPGMGLASWYISYIAAPEDWIGPMQKQKQIMAICTATPSQYAALAASELAGDGQTTHLQRLAEVRAELVALAESADLEVVGEGTACVLALRPTNTAAALSTLAEAGYALVDGADFGAPGLLRLTVTTDGNPQAALKLLA